MNDLPKLTTDRLTLDRFTDADIPRLTELCGDERIAATTLAIPHPYSEQDAEQWIARHEAMIQADAVYPFAIRQTDSGNLVGCSGFHLNATHRRTEIGYWVGVPYWRKGYCTEAGHEIIRFGFEELGLNAITCGYFVGNVASERVMEKLGIKHEGVRRHHYFRHDKFIDLAVGTLLKSEWAERQGD